MKIYLLLLAIFFMSYGVVDAQVTYSYSLADILAAMPNGIKMPDGTILKVAKIQTGTGVIEASTGTVGPFMGGTLDSLWTGCTGCATSSTTSNTLPSYIGDTNPLKFTRLYQSLTTNIDRGKNTNCKDAIGWRIYFDRPLDINSFLVVDLDGNQANNGEWSAAFSYNGTTFSNPNNKTFQTNNLQAQNITVNATHAWRTMLQAQIGATATGSFPITSNGFNLTRIKNVAGALDPDDLKTQVLYDFSLATDLFFLWGVWGNVNNTSAQNSGLSPIIVNVYPDFGDAPDSYQTLISNNGASHGQRTSITANELRLGATEDIEVDGLPSSAANSSADDDGISTISPIPNDGSLSQTIPSYSLTTSYTNDTSEDANFVAWIDWNNNGVFDSGEGQTETTLASSTTGNVTFTWTNPTLSGTSGLSNTYARIRVTTETDMTTSTPGGAFKDGEVEDYFIPFSFTLPLNLIDFSGKLNGEDVALNWHTEDEINLDNYEIQRSENAIDFYTIGSVQANNKLANEYDFNYSLSSPITRIYFRLKMNDIDGTFSYSNIVALKSTSQNQFVGKISPNPIGSEINFVYENTSKDFEMDLEVFDLRGKLLMRRTAVVNNGKNTISFSSNGLPQGMYILHYHDKLYQSTGSIKFAVSH